MSKKKGDGRGRSRRRQEEKKERRRRRGAAQRKNFWRSFFSVGRASGETGARKEKKRGKMEWERKGVRGASGDAKKGKGRCEITTSERSTATDKSLMARAQNHSAYKEGPLRPRSASSPNRPLGNFTRGTGIYHRKNRDKTRHFIDLKTWINLDIEKKGVFLFAAMSSSLLFSLFFCLVGDRRHRLCSRRRGSRWVGQLDRRHVAFLSLSLSLLARTCQAWTTSVGFGKGGRSGSFGGFLILRQGHAGAL